MNNIILDSRKIMVYEDLKYLCEFTKKPQGFADELWEGMLEYPALYEEFLFFIDNHTLKDKIRCNNYSLTDIYVNKMWNYNLFADTGKNTAECSKDSLVLETFLGMLKLLRDPEGYSKELGLGRGMDIL